MSLYYMDGDRVRWQWGKGFAHGIVQETYSVKATCRTDGFETTRCGSSMDPVLRILNERGSNIIKLASEVEPLQ